MNKQHMEMNRSFRLTQRDHKLHAHFGHPLADFYWDKYLSRDEDDGLSILSINMIYLDFPIVNIPKPFKK